MILAAAALAMAITAEPILCDTENEIIAVTQSDDQDRAVKDINHAVPNACLKTKVTFYMGVPSRRLSANEHLYEVTPVFVVAVGDHPIKGMVQWGARELPTIFVSDIYAEPNLSDWYRGLVQPDSDPLYPAPCCGAGDAYYADRTEPCTHADGPDCALVAIITDTRPDHRELPGGYVVNRPHIKIGTRVPVPRSKIRVHPVPNPTDHNVIFVANYSLRVWCWEPVATF